MNRLILLTVSFFLSISVLAKDGEYKFTHINTSNSSISYDGISKITQDSRGFIWIGTFKGLNRYDGSRFRVYYKDELGLESDFIHTILEDREGNIWVGTDNGVSRYIYNKDRFEPFLQIADNGAKVHNKVTFLYMDSHSKIWMIVNYQGCFCYDPSDGSLKNFKSSPHPTSPEYNVDEITISFRRMVEDEKGNFWVSKYHSNILYSDSDFSRFTKISTPYNEDYFKGDQVEQMWYLNKKLVLATNNHGLSSYDPETHKVITLMSLPAGVTLVDAYLQEGQNIWLCTTDGVWKYSLNGEPTIHITSDSLDPLSMSGHYVFAAFVDRDGGLWLGTKDGGVSYSGIFQQRINKVVSASDSPLRGSIVTGFSSDGKGTVWVTTEQNGLLKYSTLSGKAERISLKGVPKTLCFPCYDNGILWLGSFEGLYSYNVSNGTVKNYGPLKRQSGATDPRVYRAFKISASELYFSNTLGLFRYEPSSDGFHQLSCFDGAFVTSLAEAPDGTLWASTYAQGLIHYDPQSDEIIRIYKMGDESALPSDKISSVFVDGDGIIWTIGFSCGISRLKKDGHFTNFNTDNTSSMPSNVFFTAVQDEDFNLWLSSDKGLVKCFLPTMTFTTYTVFDGLLDTKLTNSLLHLKSGEIFAGCDNGFIHFNPSTLPYDQRAPEVIISKINVVNKTISGNVDLMDAITLSQSEKSFRFQFSVMSFGARADCRVECCLEGHDKKWIDVTANKSINYLNVPTGKYLFRVRSSTGGDKWEERDNPIEITIRPPFLLSIAGILLIIFILGLLMAIVSYLVYRRQKIKSKIEEEAIRRSAEEESFRDKMNFFSHVVHEIKTPLTLIRTPLQNIAAKDQFDDETRHDLQVMQNNTEYLISLVNELLRFIRVERKGYMLNCEKIDIADILSLIIFNYRDTATNRNIRLNVSGQESGVWINADAAAVNKILNNLLSNALKYAESHIDISMYTLDDKMVLDISNDGETIPQEYRENVFKPFFQYQSNDNARAGVGIGLPLARSLARMHSGDLLLTDDSSVTIFRLTLPICEAPTTALSENPLDDYADEPTRASENELPLILIVDDYGEMRDYISRKLSDSYSILTAKNADDALQLLSDNNVNLMITDITMPGKDGLQLCRDVRANMEISHIPIIVLSARTSTQSKIQAMEAGADLYIEKPFDLDYLKISLSNILDRRSLMHKAVSIGMGDVDISMFGLPKLDEEFFQSFDRIIMENITNSELSNEFLAEKLCVSQSTLIRKIRKLLNTSPNNYIRNKRLSLAAKMLKDSHGHYVTDICYSVGFTNVSYFAKCFKEQYGVTPSEWADSQSSD